MTTATFTQAGDYEFLVTIIDTSGNMVTSVVRVTVQAVRTSLQLQPSIVTVAVMGTEQFNGVVQDQFGDAITSQPTVTWSVSGGGTVNATGLFTAGATAGGPHALTATSGTVTATATITIDAMADTQPPQVQLIAPVANARVSGLITLVAQAMDNVAVTKVEFFEGTTKLGEVTAAPWQLDVDTTPWTNGMKSLTAKASDAAGNTTTSAIIVVIVGMVMVDQSPPVVSIRLPTAGAQTTLSVMLAADASDDVGVTHVDFELDGAQVNSDAVAPYEATVSVTAGAHSLVAIAFDASGKFTRSAAVSFTAVDSGGDGGTSTPDAGMTSMPDAGTMVEPDGGTSTPDAGTTTEEPRQPGVQELVIGGCGCNGVGAAPWGLLGLLLMATRARRRR